ncbi:Voltage-dependent calcium channel alpha-1 subunit [Cryptosporidium felis]|nr:Voltage-dependent calcium channel alpha-1 subunit [Cryptosporidium felis]
MENYYFSEIDESELLDDDRCNDETFQVGEVGDDWVPSMTLKDFGVNSESCETKEGRNRPMLEELFKSKEPLTVEEIEVAMMSQEFFRDHEDGKTRGDSLISNVDEDDRDFSNGRRFRAHSGNFHSKNQNGSLINQRQKNGGNQPSILRKNDDRSLTGSKSQRRGNIEGVIDHESSREAESIPEIPFSKYIFPLTATHISNIISKNLSSPSNWNSPPNRFEPSTNNGFMVSRDFDVILRIQLQQMAERPEIQSYSSKWNRRLLARKHNLPLGQGEHAEDKDTSKNSNRSVQEMEDKQKNVKESSTEQDSNRIRKFGKSTYSTVRGARELIKVHNLSREDNLETKDELNIKERSNQVKSSVRGDYTTFGNLHYYALSKYVFEVLHDGHFSFNKLAVNKKVDIIAPGPLVFSIIEAGNDLLQDINYFDNEIENCPTGHLQARLRLDQELRDTIELIFQLIFGFSKSSSEISDKKDSGSGGESPKTVEISCSESNIASLDARRWLLSKILSVRKGRHFILSLFHMPHVSENYMTILLESISACNEQIIEIFRSSSIILPPLMVIVPRAFRFRQGQDLMVPHEGFGYSGNVDKLIDEWRNIHGGGDPYGEQYVTKEDLVVKAKLGVRILEVTALLANRTMQSNNYRENSSLVPTIRALLRYYSQEAIQKLLGISTGVVFLALLYNSISAIPRQIELLKEFTKSLVMAFTNYLLEKNTEGSFNHNLKLSSFALKDSEPVVLCVLQRSTNDPDLRAILMNSISAVVGKENNDLFISELQELIVRESIKN